MPFRSFWSRLIRRDESRKDDTRSRNFYSSGGGHGRPSNGYNSPPRTERPHTAPSSQNYGPVDIGTLGGSAYDSYGGGRSRCNHRTPPTQDYGTVDLGTIGGSAYDNFSSRGGGDRLAQEASSRYGGRESSRYRSRAEPTPVRGQPSRRAVSPVGAGRFERYGPTRSNGDHLAREASRRRNNVSPLGSSRFEQSYSAPSTSYGSRRSPPANAFYPQSLRPQYTGGYSRGGGHGASDNFYNYGWR